LKKKTEPKEVEAILMNYTKHRLEKQRGKFCYNTWIGKLGHWGEWNEGELNNGKATNSEEKKKTIKGEHKEKWKF